jgi:hypothetical protein
MSAPETVAALVERFASHREDYRSGRYNEAQLREEFLNPFFAALGWDVYNKKDYAEAYKEVIHEAAIKVGGHTKAPDYCFRAGGGVPSFFVEAKKPAVDIRDAVSPAYQLRRYAWSAKLPVSILTDFAHLAVYDCRIRPMKTDRASTARIMYLSYDQYVERWEELEGLFSPEAIHRGALDKFVKSKKVKKGTDEVDDAFLDEIQTWRETLANNLTRRNRSLSQRDLNFAVQRIIDRIVFLRICEDRGIERYATLQRRAKGPNVYQRLGELFQRADERYNSGLFYFAEDKGRGPADELTLSLTIDDKVLKGIIRGLYYPDSPYEFSVLPVEILGHVYEQFLGKVIRLTSARRARVEDKPEVKKAGGVYYTPTFIVAYIVKHTVGKLLEGKKPTLAGKLRILDPACGSGSFLVGAYQYLLDWHRDWYVKDDPEKHARGRKPRLYRSPSGDWRLTTAERKRILLNNIHGVDIDPQAVEVTKLSLLLKVLEGESQETLSNQLRLFHERALPDLGSNIKCGNSLIGPDFYEERQTSPSDEEVYRINAFDWEAEFPAILKRKNGGFDAVIGNPPYVDSEWMTTHRLSTRQYCTPRYRAASGNWDMFCVFCEKAISLCRRGGFSGFIVPNKLGSAGYAAGARGVLAVTNRLERIRDYSRVAVFPVAVYPIVYVAVAGRRARDGDTVEYERMRQTPGGAVEVAEVRQLPYAQYFADPAEPWAIFGHFGGSAVLEKMKSHPPLQSLATVLGAATVSEAYQLQPLISQSRGKSPRAARVVNSGTIDRYHLLWKRKPLRYLRRSYERPVILARHLKELPPKRREQTLTPKVIVAGMTKRLECAADLKGRILAAKSTSIVLSSRDLRYLLGVLNSAAMAFYYRSIFGGNQLQGGYLRIGPPQLRALPVPDPQQMGSRHRKIHDQIVDAVDQITALHKQADRSGSTHDRTALARQIDATDRQIDRLVYELYGLTDDEIVIVEQATR